MCGRFVSASPPEEIAAYFGAERTAEVEVRPNYNVAPTTDVLVVYDDGGIRRLDPFRWGLVPSWAKDIKIGSRMINARSETVAEKPAFRSSFAKHRCIVPVDGFYEWKVVAGSKAKQPYFIHRPDGEPYAFAGLWSEWKGVDDHDRAVRLRSATILTGDPNAKMAAIHDRMPIILPPSAWEEWLDESQTDVSAVSRFLVPAPDELIEFHPVSTEVNSVRNRGAQLMDRADPVAPNLLS